MRDVFVSYKRILIVISHSQDFLNGICTNIIHMNGRKLHYYGVSHALVISCIAQWLERRSLTGELSLASARSAVYV